MDSHAWALISKSVGEIQYGGNTGYADQHQLAYQYDSDVANHKQVQKGDFVVIRDSAKAYGIAMVESIAKSLGTKNRQRCPVCGKTDLKRRTKMEPAWRCSAGGHEFDSPVEESAAVEQFVAHFGNSYFALNPPIPKAQVKAAALRPSDQLSIEEIDLALLESSLVKSSPSAEALIKRYSRGLTPNPEAADDTLPNHDDGEFKGTLVDSRRSTMRSILVRRGQTKFRSTLVKRYGSKCMISGCNVMAVVEAAHIKPYRGDDDNHAENGLLLRADLHTLFDLDMLAVDPEKLTVHLRLDAAVPGYAEFNGKPLLLSKGRRPSKEALSERWAAFQSEQMQVSE